MSVELIFKRNVTVIFNTWVLKMLGGVKIAFFNAGYSSVTITSGIEGTHSATSSHYEGRALDFRLPSKAPDANAKVVGLLQEAVGNDFLVLLETDHIHIQVKRGVSP